ncbi:MAG TPA: bifunctional homocysteine S-methyltransferase/methylenetetrahydrofolate reductase [Acidimicrobiales bacterium]|nr:bifunctional homocysteine S-methyltransferase/methylenetetrahydrofolate reductase [Acidimicrobiales bacterium]
MTEFRAELGRRVLVCDGAMGTMLHAAGHTFDGSLAMLNASSPGVVAAIHESYITAGADVIQTNTFGASRLRLALRGHADDVAAINLAGAKIAQEVTRLAERPVFVAGSVSPATTFGQRARVPAEERRLALHEQIAALHAGGIDLVVLETFGYLDELIEAIDVAAEFDLPIVAQATFADDGLTLSGHTPQDVGRALDPLPVDVVGVNCTVGPRKLVPVVAALAAATSAPLSVQPNAGQPQRLLADRTVGFAADPEYFASFVGGFVDAGAALIGGCCGTTPAVIRAVAEQAAARQPIRAARRSAAVARPATSAAHVEHRQPLGRRLVGDEFLVIVEVTAPTGDTLDDALQLARHLRRQGVDLILVPSSIGARAQISPLSLAIALRQQANVEPLLAVATWEKSVMALQAEMLGAHALEIHNVVCETGGVPAVGDYPVRDGMWETDSVGLVTLLAGLNQARDCNGLALRTSTSFVIGARCNLGRPDLDAEIARARTKVDAGAHVLLTHPIYEPEALRRLRVDLPSEAVSILAMVRPLHSADEAEYLFHEVPDVYVPRDVLDAMRSAGSAAADRGVELAGELLHEIRPLVNGVAIAAERVEHLDRLATAALRLRR